MTTSFDIVIPTFNNVEELRSCLGALSGSTSQDFRVLVCVDGSSDGTNAYLASARFTFSIQALEHPDGANHGRAAARNLALPHLLSRFVLMLDSDMRLEPEAIARHRGLLDRQECVSVGDVVYLNADENIWARYQGTRGKNKFDDGAEIRPLDFNTQNVGLRREDVVELGGFDATLSGYGGEDTEFGLRLARLRRPLIFNRAARAVTIEDKSVDEALGELRRYAKTNLHAIRAKHPTASAPFWVDRIESKRLRDRALRMLLNPITDAVVDLALPRVPFAIQRRLLNYKVIRTVFTGYLEGSP